MTADHTHSADIDTTAAFINTLRINDGAPVEKLTTADEAIAFLTGTGLAHEDVLRRQAAESGAQPWLDRVRQARAALRAVWDAEVEDRVPDAVAIEAINDVLREAPRIELVIGEGGCGIGHRHTADDPTGEALARLMEPFVVAVGAGATDRLRNCANDDCHEAMIDTSRAGRRRWCEMASCGNAAKAKRHRERKKAEAATAAPAHGASDDEAAAIPAAGRNP
jgi:predicted RNA-binding Zn ribbon-like protein